MKLRTRRQAMFFSLIAALSLASRFQLMPAAAATAVEAPRLAFELTGAPSLYARHAPLTLDQISAGDLVQDELAVSFNGEPSEEALAELGGMQIALRAGVPALGVYSAALPAGLSPQSAIEALGRISGVIRVEPLPRLHWDLQPNDPLYSQQQPYLDLIEAQQGWDLQPGNASIVVAVLDSGVDVNQPDLQGRIWTNPDSSGSGCPGDVHGCNFVPSDYVDSSCPNTPTAPAPNGDIRPLFYHGTFIAGIIGANVDNGIGMAGIERQANIMPVRVGDCIAPLDMPIANGVVYAVQHGARVINLSSGAQGCSSVPSFVLMALDYALSRGVVVVAAAGNDGLSCVGSPANYPGVIAVGASDGDRRPSFSQWGKEIAVVAPGIRIVGALPTSANAPDGGYRREDGTSFSAPMGSALAALLLSQNPLLSIQQVRTLMQQGATPLAPGNQPGWYGAGRIDVARSLSLVPQTLFGQVSAMGRPVPDGTEVDAAIAGTICASTTTYTYAGASWYELYVPPSAATAGCGAAGVTVYLLVGGVSAGTAPWAPAVQQLDLAVNPGAGPPA